MGLFITRHICAAERAIGNGEMQNSSILTRLAHTALAYTQESRAIYQHSFSKTAATPPKSHFEKISSLLAEWSENNNKIRHPSADMDVFTLLPFLTQNSLKHQQKAKLFGILFDIPPDAPLAKKLGLQTNAAAGKLFTVKFDSGEEIQILSIELKAFGGFFETALTVSMKEQSSSILHLQNILKEDFDLIHLFFHGAQIDFTDIDTWLIARDLADRFMIAELAEVLQNEVRYFQLIEHALFIYQSYKFEVFDLSHWHVTDAHLRMILPFTFIKKIIIVSEHVTDEGLKFLPPNLEELVILQQPTPFPSRGVATPGGITNRGLMNLPGTLKKFTFRGHCKGLSMRYFPNLTDLSLSVTGTYLTGDILQELPRTLRRVNLAFPDFALYHEDIRSIRKDRPHLSTVDLFDVQAYHAGIDFFNNLANASFFKAPADFIMAFLQRTSGFKQLKRVTFRDTEVTDSHLSLLQTSVESLDISKCRLIRTFDFLLMLTHLKSLNISNTSISADMASHLCQLKSLEELNICNTPQAIPALKALSTTLKSLVIGGSDLKTYDFPVRDDLSALDDLCDSIFRSRSPNFDDTNIALIPPLERLQKIVIEFSSVTNKGIAELAKKCPSLQKINITFNHHINNQVFHGLSNLEHLEDVELVLCDELDDLHVERFPELLRRVSFFRCGHIKLYRKLPTTIVDLAIYHDELPMGELQYLQRIYPHTKITFAQTVPEATYLVSGYSRDSIQDFM